MGTGEGGGQNCLGGWEQVRVGARTIWGDGNRRGWEPEPYGGMRTGEGGAQERLEPIETGEGWGQISLEEWNKVREEYRTVSKDGSWSTANSV
jgi:hypothetical protein